MSGIDWIINVPRQLVVDAGPVPAKIKIEGVGRHPEYRERRRNLRERCGNDPRIVFRGNQQISVAQAPLFATIFGLVASSRNTSPREILNGKAPEPGGGSRWKFKGNRGIRP
jgi:hypothetical protein